MKRTFGTAMLVVLALLTVFAITRTATPASAGLGTTGEVSSAAIR